MFLLPLPAAARVAVRHLSVRRLWAPGSAAADMTKVRGRLAPGAAARVLPTGDRDFGAGRGRGVLAAESQTSTKETIP